MSKYEDNLQLLIDKVDGVVDMGWDDVCDAIDLDVHPDSLRKAFAVTDYSGYNVAKYLMNKTASELTDDMVERLQNKKEYKERVRLQDARREYNKELRVEARYENLRDILYDKMVKLTPDELRPFGEKHLHIEDKKQKHGVLMLSDWHYGAICDSQWNYYDTVIAEQRAEQLIDKVQKYILALGITDLTVEINGDMVDGEIHVAQRVAAEESTVEQIIDVSKLLTRCINSLKPYVRSLRVITTLANKKDQAFEKENFEMLLPEFLRLALGDDVPVITSQGLDFTQYTIDDKVICLAHGHHDRVKSALNHMIRVYRVVPDEVHLAHYHHMSDLNDSNTHVTVNGSLKGVDDFALKATRCVTQPSQNLIVYGEDRMMIEVFVD